MRIAVFHDDCGDPGGANTYRLRLCSLLEERGHEIFLFTYRGEEGMKSDPHTTIFVPGGPRSVGGRIPHHRLPDYTVFSAVRKWLQEKKPDILHIHTNFAFTSSVLLGCRGITPVVQTVHDFRLVCPIGSGVTPEGRLCGGNLSKDCVDDRCISKKRYLFEVVTRRLQRSLFKRAVYRLIAPSKALHISMVKDGLPSVHIPHYSNTACDFNSLPEREKNLVLFVGYLHFSKGVDLLIRAFREVLEEIPSAKLLIAGNGPVEDELLSLHQSLDLGEAVKFLGEVPEEEIPVLYGRSSFVVLPSIVCENSPLIIYEAMICGRAVLGSRIGGIPELVEDGKTGLLFECNNKSDLASKMVTLLKNEALVEQMGAAGRRRAETEFTVEKHLEAILGLYESARQAMK
jgi:glycosyltransferase involved in cell wall biosynthesis